jgi:hypothetical protein
MSGSSSSSPPRAAELSSSWRPETATRDKKVGSSSRPAARPAREDQRMVHPHVAPNRTGASKLQRAVPHQADPPEAVGGVTSPRPPTFRRFRPPRLGLAAEASVTGEVDGLSVDIERAAGGGFQRRPTAPTVITYPGWRSPGCSCFPRRRWGSRTNPDRCRGWRISPRVDGGAHCHR